jgi:hypothetical protein
MRPLEKDIHFCPSLILRFASRLLGTKKSCAVCFSTFFFNCSASFFAAIISSVKVIMKVYSLVGFGIMVLMHTVVAQTRLVRQRKSHSITSLPEKVRGQTSKNHIEQDIQSAVAEENEARNLQHSFPDFPGNGRGPPGGTPPHGKPEESEGGRGPPKHKKHPKRARSLGEVVYDLTQALFG